MGRDIQCRGIHRVLISYSGFGALRFEYAIDFFFDFGEFGVCARPAAYSH
jgi:hypothetical protein